MLWSLQWQWNYLHICHDSCGFYSKWSLLVLWYWFHASVAQRRLFLFNCWLRRTHVIRILGKLHDIHTKWLHVGAGGLLPTFLFSESNAEKQKTENNWPFLQTGERQSCCVFDFPRWKAPFKGRWKRLSSVYSSTERSCAFGSDFRRLAQSGTATMSVTRTLSGENLVQQWQYEKQTFPKMAAASSSSLLATGATSPAFGRVSGGGWVMVDIEIDIVWLTLD